MSAVTSALAKEVECPYCGGEVELTDAERKVGKFLCPLCQKEIDREQVAGGIHAIALAKEIECPYCRGEIELTDAEREAGKFVCPLCQKEVDRERVAGGIREVPGETSDGGGLSKKRGGGLAAFLIALFVFYPLLGLLHIFSAEGFGEKATHRFSDMLSIFMLLLCSFLPFVNVIFTILVWNWRKFGLYGIWVASIVISIIELSVGVRPAITVAVVAAPIILTLLVNRESAKFT